MNAFSELLFETENIKNSNNNIKWNQTLKGWILYREKEIHIYACTNVHMKLMMASMRGSKGGENFD